MMPASKTTRASAEDEHQWFVWAGARDRRTHEELLLDEIGDQAEAADIAACDRQRLGRLGDIERHHDA